MNPPGAGGLARKGQSEHTSDAGWGCRRPLAARETPEHVSPLASISEQAGRPAEQSDALPPPQGCRRQPPLAEQWLPTGERHAQVQKPPPPPRKGGRQAAPGCPG